MGEIDNVDTKYDAQHVEVVPTKSVGHHHLIVSWQQSFNRSLLANQSGRKPCSR